MIHLRRLLKAIIYIGVTLIFATSHGQIHDRFWSFLIRGGYSEGWLNAFGLLGFLVAGFFLVGLYFLFTFHLERHPTYEISWATALRRPTGRDIDTPNGNISKLQKFRDSKLGAMSQGTGAKEYLKTAWIDGLANGGSNTSAAKRFVDSKLGSMSTSDGYNWIKKNSK